MASVVDPVAIEEFFDFSIVSETSRNIYEKLKDVIKIDPKHTEDFKELINQILYYLISCKYCHEFRMNIYVKMEEKVFDSFWKILFNDKSSLPSDSFYVIYGNVLPENAKNLEKYIDTFNKSYKGSFNDVTNIVKNECKSIISDCVQKYLLSTKTIAQGNITPLYTTDLMNLTPDNLKRLKYLENIKNSRIQNILEKEKNNILKDINKKAEMHNILLARSNLSKTINKNTPFSEYPDLDTSEDYSKINPKKIKEMSDKYNEMLKEIMESKK